MKKIAIVGANSYIARNIIYMLKGKGHEIKLYDYAEKQIDNEPNYFSIDVLSKDSVSNIDFSCDIIFMFVGKTGSLNGFDDFVTFVNINEIALLNILNEYRNQCSKAKIIFPSTRLVYKGKKGQLNENSEKEFKTIYAINKFACETYLRQYHDMYGINYVIFRICVPYGTIVSGASSIGTAEFMLSKATIGCNISLYGSGLSRRTLTHIEDLCNTLIKGAFCEKCRNDVYNIGGEEYSLKEMAEMIAKRFCVGINYVEWPALAYKIESGDTVFDDNKLKKIIGNTINHNFKDWVENITL